MSTDIGDIDTTTRPLKRARLSPETDDSPLHPSPTPSTHSLANLEHHPEFWFEDGNIILIAQHTGFRIFRGLLAVQSTVFADMFVAASSQADNISKTDNLWKSGRSGQQTPPKWTPGVDHHAGTRLARKLSGGLPRWSLFGCQTFLPLRTCCGEYGN